MTSMIQQNTDVSRAGRRAGLSGVMSLLLWALIPAIGFMVVELQIGRFIKSTSRSGWRYVYDSVSEKPDVRNVFFVGSSRTGAAINTASFESAVAEQDASRKIRAHSLGIGYSTLYQHYLGLRNLSIEKPQSLRNAVVFVELLNGLPVSHNEPHKDWLFQNALGALPEVFRSRDFAAWMASDYSMELKWNLAMRWLTRGSYLLSYGATLGSRSVGRLTDAFSDRVMRLACGAAVKPESEVDLTSAGGIRTDQEGIELVKREVDQLAKRSASDQSPWRQWDQAVVGRIVQLVEQAGGWVVFYAVPHYSKDGSANNTPLRLEDRRLFIQQVKSWNSTILRVNPAFADEDFPDHLHMNRKRGAEFSQSLAREWLAVDSAAPKP